MNSKVKDLLSYVVIVVVVVLFRSFIATPVRVDGDSMYSTLKNNDILILNKLDKSYDRFDIVVVRYGKSKLVKRIIGLPLENIEYKDNDLYINDKLIDDIETSRTGDFSLKELYDYDVIPEDYYFVMGDNRGNSLDSRSYKVGLINKKDVLGTVQIRLFPITKIGKVN